jgi:hypothetical protein
LTDYYINEKIKKGKVYFSLSFNPFFSELGYNFDDLYMNAEEEMQILARGELEKEQILAERYKK